MADINKYHVANGRYLKEDSDYVNIAEIMQMAYGLQYSVLNNKAGVFNVDINLEAGESCAVNIFFDTKTCLSKVILPIHGLSAVIYDELSTGEYQDIITATGLDRTATFNDNSQAQVVCNALNTGNALTTGTVNNSLITNGSFPVSVFISNTSGVDVTQTVIIKFWELDQNNVLTLLQANTQLESNTEMSQYGAN